MTGELIVLLCPLGIELNFKEATQLGLTTGAIIVNDETGTETAPAVAQQQVNSGLLFSMLITMR